MVSLKNGLCDTCEDCAKPLLLLLCAKNVLEVFSKK